MPYASASACALTDDAAGVNVPPAPCAAAFGADAPAGALSRSDFTIRPCGPDPLTADRSMPFSLAMRLASGLANTRPPALACAGVATAMVGAGLVASAAGWLAGV